MTIILYTVIWCVYCSLEGVREAVHYYYAIVSARTYNINEHTLFAIQRMFAYMPFEFLTFDKANYWTLLNGVCLGLMFIFWHDGFFYWKRNKLDGKYPKKFWDMSTSSHSWMDKIGLTKPVYRIIYFIVGLTGLIMINYVN